LRKSTSTTLEPATLDLVNKTFYEEGTGNVKETRAPAGNSEQVSAPSFSADFGSEGTGSGSLKGSWGIALDASGDAWVADTGNNRIEEFSPTGSFITTYGKEGSGNVQFKEPRDIAINQSTGNMYVADSANNRIEELNSKGEFVSSIGTSGSGKLNYPRYVTIDASGDLWVSDYGNNRVVEFSSEGIFIREVGTIGTGNGQFTKPAGIAITEGSVYIVDEGNSRVEQFTTSGTYLGQFGSKGSKSGQFNEPLDITENQSTGALYVCDLANNRMEEFSPAGKFLTEWQTWGSTHEQYGPASVAVGATGKLYIDDPYVNKIGIWISPETGGTNLRYSTQFGTSGTGNGQFNDPSGVAVDGHGDVWTTDFTNDRFEEFSSKGGFIASYGKEGGGNGQFYGPAGIAINKSTGNVYIADDWGAHMEEFSSAGTFIREFGSSGEGKLNGPIGVAIDLSGDVWVTDSGNNRIVEFSSTGTYIAAYGKEGKGEAQFKDPAAIAVSGEDVYVADSANHRIEELTVKGAYVRAFGVEGNGSSEFWTPEGIAVDAAGNLYVSDHNAGHIEEFSPSGVFKATFSSPGSGEGQLTHPGGDAIDSAGDLYIVDSGDNRVELWNDNQQAAHDTQTIYYTAEANLTYPNCGNHPEWADLVCQTQPATQPDHGVSELPVTTIGSYNIWDEAEKTEEKFGTGVKEVIRTKTETYDSAGRALTSKEISSIDTALPEVTNEYNTENGALAKQSTSEGSITEKYNTLEQLIEYTDAAGNVTKDTYEEGGDGRLVETREGKGEEAKSSQTFSYDLTTGFITKLIDSAAGTFTASYDLEGTMNSETYPNNMTANYTTNSVGQTTSLVYEKNTSCASKCPEIWFGDSIIPSIHGETLQQTSTLSKENYAYDGAGRPFETQETPAGKGCTVRLYAYEEESNRTSETTREPGTEGKCATEGGTIERHTYDEADHLTDEGVEYETFGNTTKLPANDEDGHEITSTYYVDNQVASEEQNKELIDYTYDPLGRTLDTISENKGTKAKSTIIAHYSGSGNALTWTSEGTEKWTRNIPGIDGTLSATQEAGKEPILQLHDLQGDIVATAVKSETESKLRSTYNSTEFGVPSEGKAPPKYAWLGAAGIFTETTFESGVSTQNGVSYIPQIARDLQTAPIVPPGAFPNGQGTGSPYSSEIPGWYISLSNAESETTAAAYQKKLEEEARKRAEEEAPKPSPGGGPMLPLGGSSGWACEDAAITDQEVPGCGPTEAEWLTAEEAFYEGDAEARAAWGPGSFKNFIEGVAHEASSVGEYLYRNAAFNFDSQLKKAKASWNFFVELFNPDGFAELGFSCAKGAKDGTDSTDALSQELPPAGSKVVVGVGLVLGCINGVGGG
jgi:tripartite motif-containing protein 71